MSTIQGRSSLACSVSSQARLVRQLKRGRRLRGHVAKKKKRKRGTVLCFIPHPLPVFISLRRRGVERTTAFSFPPRSKGRITTCPKRRRYDAPQKPQKICSGGCDRCSPDWFQKHSLQRTERWNCATTDEWLAQSSFSAKLWITAFYRCFHLQALERRVQCTSETLTLGRTAGISFVSYNLQCKYSLISSGSSL